MPDKSTHQTPRATERQTPRTKPTAKSSLNRGVLVPALLFIAALVALAIAAPAAMQNALESAKGWVFARFSWLYVLCVSAFVVFMTLLALSRFGDIRLGRQDERPALPFASWLAMLFATGMGVGLLYFGAAEPLIHRQQLGADASEALLRTVFHWGIHPWAIYGVTALGMAYFGFRYDMPLSLRSAFYPLLREKIHGAAGNAIDVLALIVTAFGITTTLGYAAGQLNAGLQHLNVVQNSGFFEQMIIIITIIFAATASAMSGANKGLRRLSELNLLMALGLLAFVLIVCEPARLLGEFSANIGNYLHELIALSFDTAAYAPERAQWFSSWTIFYWAWWLSWAPFVGFFIAKISRGRSIREFIFGVLAVPTVFNILWFSVFGGAAIDIDAATGGSLSALAATPEKLLFAFLDHLPGAAVASGFALVILALFFITSADSGIFVLAHLAARATAAPARSSSLLWGCVLAALACALLYSGGLDAILAITMLVALPFALMLLSMCYSLLVGLIADERYFSLHLAPSTVYWSGEHWQERLDALLNQPKKQDLEYFLSTRALAAMQKLCAQLRERGFRCYVRNVRGERRYVKFVVEKALAKDFVYGIEALRRSTAAALANDSKLPFEDAEFYEPRTFFGDGREGYDVSFLSEREIIADILKHYERYLSLLGEGSTKIFTEEI